MILETFAALFLVYFIHYFITTLMMRRKMPPGPFPYPFLGNIPHILLCASVDPYGKLADKYGDIFTLFLPNAGKVVVLSTATLVREARVGQRENLSGKSPRSVYPISDIVGNDLVTSDYSPAFIFRRRAFKTAMHLFGSGIEQATERVEHAVNSAMQEIDSKKGQPFSPRSLVESSILAKLWNWLTSRKLQLNDPIIKLLSEFNGIFEKQTFFALAHQCIPFFLYLPIQSNLDIKRAKQIRKTVFPEAYQSQKETYTPGVIRNLIDSFICSYEKEMAKEAKKDIGSMDDIPSLMADIILGGSGTTTHTITWLLLYMVLNPDIQERIQKEINLVLDNNRLPNWKDAQNMHYLQATLCEVQRASGLIGVNGSNAIRDSKIAGYHIPKGTFVAINFRKLHQDEREWPEPEKFQPERFLDSDGKFVGWSKLNGFLPFGVGIRECPGQSLGKIMMFTFASILLYCYTFELPEGVETPTTKISGPAIISCPMDFQIVAKKRKF